MSSPAADLAMERMDRVIEANDVSRLAGGDHVLRGNLDAAIEASGYRYNINRDQFVKRT